MKYIVALKEPLGRKLLRYALWTLLLLGAAAILGWGGIKVAQYASAYRLRERVEQLALVSPSDALESARELVRREPTNANRILLARIALQASDVNQAAQALKSLTTIVTGTPLSFALKADVAVRIAPEELPSFIEFLNRVSPSSDAERFWVAWACLDSGVPELRPVASRLLNRISDKAFKNRAALLRLKLTLLNADKSEAAERAEALMGRALPPTDAVELLSIAESLGIPEAADYRSSLKLQSRNDDALRDRLGAYLKTHAARAVEAPPPAASEAPASNAQPQAPATEPVAEPIKASDPASTPKAADATSEQAVAE